LKSIQVPLYKLHQGTNPNLELFGHFIDDSSEKKRIGRVKLLIYEDTSKAAQKNLKQFEYPSKDKSLVYLETIESNQQGEINFTLPADRIFVIGFNKKSYFRSFFVVKTYSNYTKKDKIRNYEFNYTLFRCEENRMDIDTSGSYKVLVYDFTANKFSALNKTLPKINRRSNRDSIVGKPKQNIRKDINTTPTDLTQKTNLSIDKKGNSFEFDGFDTINKIDYNNQKQGKWTYSNESFKATNTAVQSRYIEGSYVDDSLEGLWNKYYNNDTVAIQFNTEKNKLTGNFKLYWPNGKIKSTGKWKPLTKKFIGAVKLFDQFGKDEIDLNYDTSGVLDGNQIIYYPNGLMAVLTSTKNGQFDGQQIVFSEEGKILLQRLYTEGKLIKEQQFEKTKNKFTEQYIKEILFQDTGMLVNALNSAAREIETLKANSKSSYSALLG
jgi:antitoxin component YwqK of YwqJK toxin-antitoxin module